jgi:hypothetical protein
MGENYGDVLNHLTLKYYKHINQKTFKIDGKRPMVCF